MNQIHNVSKECFYNFDSIGWLSYLITNQNTLIVASYLNKVVAYVYYQPNPGHVCKLGVLKEYRKRGIANHLMDMAESKCTSNYIQLEVRVTNDAAINLYVKRGYRIANVEVNYYNEEGVLADAYLMLKCSDAVLIDFLRRIFLPLKCAQAGCKYSVINYIIKETDGTLKYISDWTKSLDKI